MTTFSADRMTAPVAGHGLAGNLKVAYGSYDVATEPAPADIYEMCKVPAGAIVIDGVLRFEDIDTDATETMDLDIGWLANDDEAADADGFGNFGVQTGDAVAGYLPEGGVRLPFMGVLKDGFKQFTAETTIAVTCVDDPATFTAGTISVYVLYVLP